MRLNALLLIAALAGCTLGTTANAIEISDAVAHFNKQHPQSPPLTDGYATVGDVTYHYVSAGEGPLVILYHGFPSFWYAWKYQIPELAKHYRVVAIDGLGSNLSDKPTEISRYRIDKLASDLNQLSYQLGGDEPFYLIGHDWGGSLSWAFAQGYPQRLTKLVVLNAPPYNLFLKLLKHNEQQQKTSVYIDVLKHPLGEAVLSFNDSYLISSMAYQKHVDKHYLSETEAALFRQALARPQALHSAINWYRANAPDSDNRHHQVDWPADNPTIEIPSLLIWGEQDKAFVPEFLELLPNTAKQLTIKRFSDAGHWPGLSHSTQVNQQILEFFGTPEGQAHSL